MTSINRRDFLKSTVAAGFIPAALARPQSIPKAKSAQWFAKRGTVVRVTHPGALNEDGTANAGVVQAMVDRGIRELTQAKTVSDAWSRFVGPDDVVGLKINTLGMRAVANTRYVHHFQAVTDALANGIAATGLPKNRIAVWDRNLPNVAEANYRPNPDPDGVQVWGGREDGAEEEPVKVGEKDAWLYKTLTRKTTALVNVALAKTHRMSGVTGALKNHYGSIRNPSDFHMNNCTNPGIAELNTVEVIRQKQRLIVMDALYTVYEGGPSWNLEFMKKTNAVWVSTDPVAVDTLLLETIEALRKEAGMDSVVEIARHLGIAAKLGLGEGDPSKIKRIDIRLE